MTTYHISTVLKPIISQLIHPSQNGAKIISKGLLEAVITLYRPEHIKLNNREDRKTSSQAITDLETFFNMVLAGKDDAYLTALLSKKINFAYLSTTTKSPVPLFLLLCWYNSFFKIVTKTSIILPLLNALLKLDNPVPENILFLKADAPYANRNCLMELIIGGQLEEYRRVREILGEKANTLLLEHDGRATAKYSEPEYSNWSALNFSAAYMMEEFANILAVSSLDNMRAQVSGNWGAVTELNHLFSNDESLSPEKIKIKQKCLFLLHFMIDDTPRTVPDDIFDDLMMVITKNQDYCSGVIKKISDSRNPKAYQALFKHDKPFLPFLLEKIKIGTDADHERCVTIVLNYLNQIEIKEELPIFMETLNWDSKTWACLLKEGKNDELIKKVILKIIEVIRLDKANLLKQIDENLLMVILRSSPELIKTLVLDAAHGEQDSQELAFETLRKFLNLESEATLATILSHLSKKILNLHEIVRAEAEKWPEKRNILLMLDDEVRFNIFKETFGDIQLASYIEKLCEVILKQTDLNSWLDVLDPQVVSPFSNRYSLGIILSTVPLTIPFSNRNFACELLLKYFSRDDADILVVMNNLPLEGIVNLLQIEAQMGFSSVVLKKIQSKSQDSTVAKSVNTCLLMHFSLLLKKEIYTINVGNDAILKRIADSLEELSKQYDGEQRLDVLKKNINNDTLLNLIFSLYQEDNVAKYPALEKTFPLITQLLIILQACNVNYTKDVKYLLHPQYGTEKRNTFHHLARMGKYLNKNDLALALLLAKDYLKDTLEQQDNENITVLVYLIGTPHTNYLMQKPEFRGSTSSKTVITERESFGSDDASLDKILDEKDDAPISVEMIKNYYHKESDSDEVLEKLTANERKILWLYRSIGLKTYESFPKNHQQTLSGSENLAKLIPSAMPRRTGPG